MAYANKCHNNNRNHNNKLTSCQSAVFMEGEEQETEKQ